MARDSGAAGVHRATHRARAALRQPGRRLPAALAELTRALPGRLLEPSAALLAHNRLMGGRGRDEQLHFLAVRGVVRVRSALRRSRGAECARRREPASRTSAGHSVLEVAASALAANVPKFINGDGHNVSKWWWSAPGGGGARAVRRAGAGRGLRPGRRAPRTSARASNRTRPPTLISMDLRIKENTFIIVIIFSINLHFILN